MKKIISLALAFAMILSAVPFAFAQGETEPVLNFDGETATAENAPDGAVLAAVQYGNGGEQLDAKTAPVVEGTAEIAVEKAEGVSELKVMLWDSLEKMTPLVPAKTFDGSKILTNFTAFDAANISGETHGDIPLSDYDWNSGESGVCFSTQWSATGTWNEDFGEAGLMFFRAEARANGNNEDKTASMNFASATAGTEKIVIEYNFAMQDESNNYQTWYFKDIDGNTFATVYYDQGVKACVGEGGSNGTIYAENSAAVYALRGTPMKIEAVKGAEDWTVTYTNNGKVLLSENVPSINGFASVGANVGQWNNQYAAMALQGLKVTVYAPETAQVTVKTTFSDGREIPDKTVPAIYGNTVSYVNSETILKIDETNYIFNEEKSVTSVTAGGEDAISLVFDKFEGTGLTGDVITQEGATCWFADPRSLTVKNEADGVNTTYVGYIDVHGSVKATQYDNNTGKAEEVLVRSNFQPDDHNNPTFLELPDHRIMIFYSRHTDEACFYYRISKAPYDITTFGEEKYLKTSNNTTYPSPFILSDDPAHIYLCWRGINWHPTLGILTMPDENDNVTLELEKQIVQSTGARPYAKYTSNGKDEIWVTYTTGHPDNENPDWLYFNKININTLDVMDVNGTTLSNIKDGPLAVDKTDASRGFAVSDPDSGVRNWVWELVNDNGTPVIAQVKIDSGKTNHNYYCTTYTDGKWQETFLTYAGGKFHSSNTEYCYSGGMTIDKANPHVFYCSVPVKGVYGKVFEIVKYTMNEDYSAIESTEYITENSKENNVRPYIANGSEEGDLRLTWMNGYYQYWMVNKSYPDGFPTKMMTNFDIPEAEIVNSLGEPDGKIYRAGDEPISVPAPTGKEFTISLQLLQADLAVGGTLIKSGNLEVDLEKSTVDPNKDYAAVAPKLTAGDKTQKSDNLFSNSDWFAVSVSGTNGDKGVNSMGWIDYTVTYDGSEVVTYVNGLIDATLQDVDVTLGDTIELSGIDGAFANIRTTDKALTQAEIRADAAPAPAGEAEVTVETVVGGESAEPETVECASGQVYTAQYDLAAYDAQGNAYVFNEEKSVTSIIAIAGIENNITLVYDKKLSEENIITNGDFTDGCADWTNAADGGTYDGTISDNTEYIHGEGKALTNKASSGGVAASTVRRFVPVTGGKTYYFSYYAYNTGDALGTGTNGAMSCFVPVIGGDIYGTFNGITFKDYVTYGGQNSWSGESQSEVQRGRNDMPYESGMNHKEFIITVPEDADNFMISMFAWTAAGRLYFSDFVLREIETE